MSSGNCSLLIQTSSNFFFHLFLPSALASSPFNSHHFNFLFFLLFNRPLSLPMFHKTLLFTLAASIATGRAAPMPQPDPPTAMGVITGNGGSVIGQEFTGLMGQLVPATSSSQQMAATGLSLYAQEYLPFNSVSIVWYYCQLLPDPMLNGVCSQSPSQQTAGTRPPPVALHSAPAR